VHNKNSIMKTLIGLFIFIFLFQSLSTVAQSNNSQYKLSDQIGYSDFQVIYNWNETDEYYSSKDATFSRKYLHDTKKVKLILSVDDKHSIYEVIRKADILTLPNILVEGDENCMMPSFSTNIIVKIGNVTKSVYHSGSCDIADENIKKRFDMIIQTVMDIILNKKEVKKLPQSDITYE
jgi:hypothetical protein